MSDINDILKQLMDRLTELPAALTADGIVLKLVLSSLGSLAAYGLYKVLRLQYRYRTSPLNDLPGPPSDSLILGNLGQIRDADPGAMHVEWTEKYGSCMQYKGFFGVSRSPLH